MTAVYTGKIIISPPSIPTFFIELDKIMQKCAIYKLAIVFCVISSVYLNLFFQPHPACTSCTYFLFPMIGILSGETKFKSRQSLMLHFAKVCAIFHP